MIFLQIRITTPPGQEEAYRGEIQRLLGPTLCATGERGASVGFGYERRLSRRIGVGGFMEYTGTDTREGVVAAAFNWHPWRELKILAAPGLEIDRPDGSIGFLFRVGAEYGITMEKGFELAPALNLDFKAVNAVIYKENGVTIRSLPAIHAVDGSVSFVVEWNGLKFAFNSDTYPNKWWLEHTKNADLSIHECFAPPSMMVKRQGFAVGDALNVATQVHKSPAMFGKVMATTKPQIMQEIRQTYDGPVELAIDYMVFNVTKDEIRTRMAVIDEAIWPQPSIYPPEAAGPKQRVGFSKYLIDGRVVFEDVVQFYHDQTNKMFGTDIKAPK